MEVARERDKLSSNPATLDWRKTGGRAELLALLTEAAALAAMSGVKLLVLTHISGRYPDEEILAEATKTFPSSRVAANFDRIVI
jgi:ribonuclease Z